MFYFKSNRNYNCLNILFVVNFPLFSLVIFNKAICIQKYFYIYTTHTYIFKKRNTINNAMLQFAKRQRNYVCCNTVLCVQPIMTAKYVCPLYTYILYLQNTKPKESVNRQAKLRKRIKIIKMCKKQPTKCLLLFTSILYNNLMTYVQLVAGINDYVTEYVLLTVLFHL